MKGWLRFLLAGLRAPLLAWSLAATCWPGRGAESVLIERGASWDWRPGMTEASSPIAAWRSLGFKITEFTPASAPFWYGDVYAGGTQITGMQNVYLCLFLRKTFVITNVSEIESLRLGAIVDDGFVAWINGTEVQRANLPGAAGSPVTIGTLANNAAEPVEFTTYPLAAPETWLVPGTNVIAVQVFQSSLGSSDIGFDASLVATFREPPPDLPPIIAATTPPAGATLRSLSSLTVLFNKPVQGLDASDLLINGSAAQTMTVIPPKQYVFEFTSAAPGQVQVTWASNHGIHDSSNQPFAALGWSYQIAPESAEASPYISELMAANTRTLADENGDYSDWIEIYNPGALTLNLDGWFLTDTTNNFTKWRFPATNLAGGSFMVVFASEKDRRLPGEPLHANFKLGADGEYLALVKPDGATRASEFQPTFPPQVADVSFGFAQLGEPPLFTRSTNALYFTRPTPGTANLGGAAAPGPAILNVLHSPNVPATNENLTVTARVSASFYTLASVTLRYRVMYGSETAVPMFDDGAHGDGPASDGIFGATIPVSTFPRATGQMVRYSITATDVIGRSSRWPLFPDPTGSAEFLGTVISPNYVTSAIPIIHLFSPPNVLHPDSTAGGADSQSGSSGVSVFYDGEFYDNVYVAVRGNTTAGYAKKSHRFEFNREHPFRHPGVGYGWPEKAGTRLRKTSFVADYPDPAYMRQGLSFWLCQQAGSPATFYYPVRLQLNGQFYQLANHNDVHSEELLDRLGYDPNGALYNAVGTVETSQFSTGGFEKKTRKWEGTADYQQLAGAIADSLPVATRRTNIFDMLDLPNIINYLVAARFAQENDDVWANMSLYHNNDGDNLWRAISFDMNLSWGAFFMDNPSNDQGIQATNDIHKSFPLYGSSQALSLTSGNYNRLYDVIFDVPQTLEMFRRRMRTVLDAFVLPPDAPAGSSAVEKKILAWRDLILVDAALDRAKWGWPGIGGQNNLPAASVTEGVNDLLQKFLQPRRQHLYGKHSVTNLTLPIGTLKTQNAGFPLPQPAHSDIAVVNVEFNPSSGNQNQEYICLTNPASIALDISGWKLAGAVDFTFAQGTVIPSNTRFYVSPDLRSFRARTASPRGREGNFVLGPYSGQLSARGETIRVHNGAGDLVHSYAYPGAPTPAQQFLRVSEIMYRPPIVPGDATPPDEYEYIVLQNISTNTSLNLTGVHFTNGITFSFTNAAVLRLPPGETTFVVRNLTAFRARYGHAWSVAGQYAGALDNSGERVRLLDRSDEEVLDFRYDNHWYPATDGHGSSLVVVDLNATPDLWSSPTNWQASLPASPGDSDHDGMPDDWEIAHGLNPQLNDALMDQDGDGMTNFDEYRAGTDPGDATSYLKVTLTNSPGGGASVHFIAAANVSYTVEYADSLGTGSWQKLRDVEATATGGSVSLADPTGGTRRFYRLITPKR